LWIWGRKAIEEGGEGRREAIEGGREGRREAT
jgi:hypothetical protein